MNKEIIDRILESQDLFELADRLEEFLELLKSVQKNKNNVLYELYDPLFSWYFDNSFYSANPYIFFVREGRRTVISEKSMAIL